MKIELGEYEVMVVRKAVQARIEDCNRLMLSAARIDEELEAAMLDQVKALESFMNQTEEK